MFINDVGQNTWEEINDGIAGANYGWPTHRRRSTRRNPELHQPALRLRTTAAATCAITGGAFYNPADACSSRATT